MSYIRCARCDWSQDDFWSVGGESPYNPINSLKNFDEESLLKRGRECYGTDYWDERTVSQVIRDFSFFGVDVSHQYEDGVFYLTWQQFAAWNMIKAVRRTLNMRYRTADELQREGFVCPKCGSTHYIED